MKLQSRLEVKLLPRRLPPHDLEEPITLAEIAHIDRLWEKEGT